MTCDIMIVIMIKNICECSIICKTKQSEEEVKDRHEERTYSNRERECTSTL